MIERAFRLDFFIAIVALLFSALTSLTLIYQTHLISDQYAATIWPYLAVDTTFDAHGETVQLVNNGVGPALIRSAQLSVDGKPVKGWFGYILALTRDPQLRPFFNRIRRQYLAGKTPAAHISMSSLGSGDTLRAGDSKRLLALSSPALQSSALLKHRVAIDVCYCSLNGSCWMLHAVPSQSSIPPQNIDRCPVSGGEIRADMSSV